MNWLLAAQIPIIVIGLWFFTAYMTQSFPTLRGKRICLLIAHPDDEAMFFAPTVLHLTRPEFQNRLFILCLSSGNAEGLGSIRKRELVKSAAILGVGRTFSSESEENDNKDSNESTSSPTIPLSQVEKYVVTLDHPALPDSMTTNWDPKLISSILTQYFAPPNPRTSSSSSTTSSSSSASRSQPHQPPETKIDTILTFDRHGVSAHPNHISLYHGARLFVSTLKTKNPGWEVPIKLYTLTTVSILRKYTGLLDSLATLVDVAVLRIWSRSRAKGKSRARDLESPSALVVVSAPGGVRTAQRAMTEAHVSQMRWFRWAWIGLSRYMYVNDLLLERI